jgi:hypothetical protein
MVGIDSGLSPDCRLDDIPEVRWQELLDQRQAFACYELPRDCRRVVDFVDDADRMYKPLGFRSADELIEKGLKLLPGEARLAAEWLRITMPNHPIPYKLVLEFLCRPQRAATAATNTPAGKRQADSVTLARGNDPNYILARLDRDGHTELAARVRAGDLGAHAAAGAAGFHKKAFSVPADIEGMARVLRKRLSEEDRERLRDLLR